MAYDNRVDLASEDEWWREAVSGPFAFPPFPLEQDKGFLRRAGSAIKGAAGCAAFISTLERADGPHTLVGEEKGGVLHPVFGVHTDPIFTADKSRA